MRITCIRGNTNLISLPFILHGFGHDFVRSQASCRSSLDPLVQFAAGYLLECSLNVYGLDDVPGHTAIAYVWGDPLLEGHVEVDDMTSLKPSTMLASSCTTSNVLGRYMIRFPTER